MTSIRNRTVIMTTILDEPYMMLRRQDKGLARGNDK